MTYLLDVNTLVALGFLEHEFHGRVAGWVRKLALRGIPELATCSITELGFVRVLSQASQYGFTIAHARDVLLQLKSSAKLKFAFIPDDHDVSHLPAWVKSANITNHCGFKYWEIGNEPNRAVMTTAKAGLAYAKEFAGYYEEMVREVRKAGVTGVQFLLPGLYGFKPGTPGHITPREFLGQVKYQLDHASPKLANPYQGISIHPYVFKVRDPKHKKKPAHAPGTVCWLRASSRSRNSWMISRIEHVLLACVTQTRMH